MNIQTYLKGSFCVFRIAEDVGLASDLTVLSRLAEKKSGGKLALIKPNKSILDILKIIDFQKFVMVCSDEEELGS